MPRCWSFPATAGGRQCCPWPRLVLEQYTEFFAQVQELAASNFQYFKVYLLAGLVYLLLVSLIVLLARYLERTVLRPLL
jgi:ABC-type amino acid transport system permease subunit